MNVFSPEELLFFEGRGSALELYAALRQRVAQRFPDTVIQVGKTQISFRNRHIYACVSFLRAAEKSRLSHPYITLTVGLPYRPCSERAAAAVQPRPGRWTVHIAVGSAEELDGEVFNWLSDAYAFAGGKRSGR